MKTSVEFIYDIQNWPGLVLPVIKHKGSLDVGIIFDSDIKTVILANIWAPETWDTAKKITYNSVEELVENGWQVD